MQIGNNKLSKYIDLSQQLLDAPKFGDTMFRKNGDLNPITIIDPIDVDSKSTKKSLKKAIETVKDLKEAIVLTPKNEKPETK